MTRATRRQFALLAAAGAAAAFTPQAHAQNAAPLITRAIPKSGEQLPAVGLGTAYVFDNDSAATRGKAEAVIKVLAENGGTLIDTASTYGDAESVIGAVLVGAGGRQKFFVATKLEAPDAAELRRSLARLKTPKVDLLQLHNVSNPRQSLARFAEWKAQGVCRYVGITSTFHGEFGAVEAVLGREKPDFVQIDYSLDNREVEKRILPLAAEVKAAVLTALPFGRGRLFRAVRGKAVPDWAQSFAGSWAQFFLNFFARRSAGDRGHSRHRRSRAHARQCRRHARRVARSRPAPPHGAIRRRAIARVLLKRWKTGCDRRRGSARTAP